MSGFASANVKAIAFPVNTVQRQRSDFTGLRALNGLVGVIGMDFYLPDFVLNFAMEPNITSFTFIIRSISAMRLSVQASHLQRPICVKRTDHLPIAPDRSHSRRVLKRSTSK
jgi:hypothetical protein